MSASPLIEIQDVTVDYRGGRSTVRALDGVSFSIGEGDCLGLVGESGCGKSTLGRAIVGLVAPTSGRILYRGEEIGAWRAREGRRFCRRIQMVFQDPMGSLNPRIAAGAALDEILRVHGMRDPAARRARGVELFEAVELDPSWADRYPHEFSGGQRQRLGIARALAVEPEVLIADEPVSALDVSVQAQVLNLLRSLQARRNLTCLFIAHDLAVVRYLCPRVVILYRGRVMELGSSDEVYGNPLHPYTQTMLAAVPDVEKGLRRRAEGSRPELHGEIPPSGVRVEGCPFHPRCPRAIAVCREEAPGLRENSPGHGCACHVAGM